MHDPLITTIQFLFAAVLAVPIFRRLKLGAILGYLVAGAVIGPHLLNFVDDPANTLHFAEIGVVLLLFLIGLELSPDKLWRMRDLILMLGTAQLLGTAACIFGLLFVFANLPPMLSILIGLALALSSTAFAIQLMADYRILNTNLGNKGFSILLMQDLAVIPILLLVEAASGSTADSGPAWWLGALAIVGVLLAGRLFLNPLLRIVANHGSTEIMTAAALLIVLGTALLMEEAGLSMGMGAFTAGILLANSTFRHQLEVEVEPFKGLLLGLFFIAIGMNLDLNRLLEAPLLIAGLAVALISLKTTLITLIVRLRGASFHDSVRLGLMLSQGGEFAFVVMTQAVSVNVIEPALANYISLVVGISMALTSPLLILYNAVLSRTQRANQDYDTVWDGSDPDVIIAGFGRFGQITGRILAANNIPFTALDKNAEHIEFVKQFGNKIFFGDATRIDLLRTAGIDHAKVLLIAIEDEEKVLEIIETVRAQFPTLKIVARAHNRVNLVKQLQQGADASFRETFGSSLSAAIQVLQQTGMPENEAIRLAATFRDHDQAMINEALQHPADVEHLIDIGERGRAELEELFRHDKGDL